MTSANTVPIEAVQQYWNQRPCNIRHSTRPVGTREYFDEVEQRKYFVEPHIPAFAQFERWEGKNVLEIGCGIGTDTMNFARHGAWVTAVDVSENSLQLARQRAQVYGVEDRVRFFHGDAERLSPIVPPEPYDLIYSFGVIHHTPHPERVFQEIRRIAQPGAHLKIMVYHRYAWKVLWILLKYGKGRFWRLSDWVARYSEAQTGCPVTYSYSRRQCREMLAQNGFQVNGIRVEHIFPYRIADYIEHRYVKEWYFRWMPDALFHGLEHRFGWHLCADAEVKG
ncbi:MAG: class I SAM-dependent methyltransferase [bacterium]